MTRQQRPHFDTCRNLRNELTYEAADVISEVELEEILAKVPEFASVVEAWLGAHHPELAAK